MLNLRPSICLVISLLNLNLLGGIAAQENTFKYKYFSVEDGLSSRFLTNVVQDDQGFIWIGSDFGINRFDGRDFKKFNANNSQLRSNSRSFLCKDVHGKIWVNNDRRLVDIIDPVTEEVTQLEKIYPPFEGKPVTLLTDRVAGEVWGIVNADTLFQYDGDFHFFNALPKKASSVENRLLPTPWKTFLFQENPGLTEYDENGAKLNYYPEIAWAPFVETLDSSMLLFSYAHVDNRELMVCPKIWKLTKNKAPVLMNLTQNGKRFQIALMEGGVWSIAVNEDLKGNTWLLMQNQLYAFNKNGEMVAAATDFQGSASTQLNSKSIFLGSQGETWICGTTGIYALMLEKKGFNRLLNSKEGFGVSVRGIEEIADGHLIACTYNGVFQIDVKTGKADKISDHIHYGIFQDKDHSIWLGQHFSEIRHTKLESWDKSKVISAPHLPADDEFMRPFADTYGEGIYVGCRRQGLLVFDESKKQLVPYTRLNEFTELARSEITFLHAKKDCIWLAANTGLYKIHRQHGIVAHYKNFPQNYIYHFSEDKDGIFWLATRGGGLIRWDSKTGASTQFNTNTGLSNDIIYAAYDDGLGYLWLPSNYGLMRFEKSTGVTFNYLVSDGITHEEFNNTSHLRGSDGTLYFGGLNGITVVHPSEIVSNKNEAPMVITGFNTLENNQLIDGMKDYRREQEITIQPGQQFFSLNFALQDFLSRKQSYAWKLDGLDNEWTAQTENTIRLKALPYGDYTLRIKGKGDGVGWSSKELAIPIHVIRPFYLTWKFVLLVVALALLFFYLFSQWRLRRLQAEKQRLSKIIEERTQELLTKNVELEALNQTKDRLFTIIAHDLRSPLITLGGLARKVAFLLRQNRMEEVQELGETVENSVANVRNLLDNLLKWSIMQDGKFPHHPEILPAGELAEEAISLYSVIAEAKGVKLFYQIFGTPSVYADRNSVSTVIRNLVDNALKFTHEGGTVSLTVEKNGHNCVLKVSDTGIGIPDSELSSVFTMKNASGGLGTKGEKGNGLGLALCKELVELNGGSIEVRSQLGNGTTFTVCLPASEKQPISAP